MNLLRAAGSTLRKLMLPGVIAAILTSVVLPAAALASELDLQLPVLDPSQRQLLFYGLGVCVLGMVFGLVMFQQVKAMPAHSSMLSVSHTIYETCKAYLLKQGQLLIVLELFIGACIVYYFGFIQHMDAMRVVTILLFSILGILGSYGVAWFGIRMNTFANSRTAFASLEGKPLKVYEIPLQAGMSIGVLLICVELLMMLAILLWVPAEQAGACFLGFAIGESLGASALRIAGGIFTKIADIGSDLMKVVFKIKEDDPRNPGVIADCTGDNAGDSVGPTADGFETYGVTGVALISFIALAVIPEHKALFLVWIFVMRVLMIGTSIVSYLANGAFARAQNTGKTKIDFEAPLTSLVWVCSILSIVVTFIASKWLLAPLGGNLWVTLSVIISCGTLAAAVIPEFTKVFTSAHSRHVQEVVSASKEGGASLNILSGLVAGNFSVFWKSLTLAVLLFLAFYFSQQGLAQYMTYPAVFAFGLVAFGLLGMGPVTIAVDSYGPVTDNAQSIFELSQIESTPGAAQEIEKQFGFKPDFERGKHYLEDNDGAGNTFKATAKPVLIATAVAGATTMLFSIVLTLQKHFGLDAMGGQNFKLDLLDPYVLLGLLMGGGTVYWFTGASIQAVTTGAYRAVEYIKKNIKLDSAEAASIETSRTVVEICTKYAQDGMFNIFIVIFCLTIAYAFFNPVFFIAYLVSIAVVGLFQAVYMANAGGAWDNAKKVVEVELNAKGTPLHDATVIGDTVGDPYKDTSSVALNPIIKFTTLFGLLAVEMAVANPAIQIPVAVVFMLIALVFVYRSFYGMRISSK
ncbi:MAG: sodium-translocating pyrophosphatase [Candidatus Eisenbacteria bacterium]|uniref:K(+)-insensitive pyrophosphate-energized proton pump n=1 Tax=Eiseniibacteriota bacterium TaxID=2212470 RepID=A0A849SC24_UNCEI|nr:sodium-translocating pyrophosphatase [Candidatus Eisenbacteria bacterium]